MINKSLIINLIGDKHNVYKSALEIHQLALNKHFGSKIIDNYDLLNELNRQVKRNLLINKCNNLRPNQLKKLNNYIYDLRNINIFSYTLFIIDNELIIKNSLNVTNNIYNVDNPLNKKEIQINNLLFSDYNRFM